MAWQFATTSWTQVLAARGAGSSDSRQALAALCEAYWYPLYAFVRRQGIGADEARDLTQAYFAELVEKGYLEDVDPERGRFRVFLKASVRNFLSKQRDKAHAWKRGGRATIESLETQDAEGRYQHEPADRLTPEDLYERRWALTLLSRALDGLRAEYRGEGREREFERLQGLLTGEQPQAPYRELAAELGSTEAAVKTAVHRLRRRFGARLRDEIAATVAGPDAVDDEVRYLLKVIASGRAGAASSP